MHAKVLKSAKKKALSALISQMRKLEMKEGSPKEEHMESADEEAAEGHVLEPDMSDLEDVESSEGPMVEEDEEDDPKAALKGFMKQSSHMPHRGRATVVVTVGKKSPSAQMKKTFGAK